MSIASIRAALEGPLGGLGPLPDGWDESLAKYVELVQARNQKVNLVSRASVDRLVEAQLLPCLAALLVVPANSRVTVLDVGSGGGFPGIPLKILRPDVRLDLVDARRKKTDFLLEAVHHLGLDDCAVHWCRIEEPTEQLAARAPFDRAFARAVGAEDLLRSALPPLLSVDGSAWTFVAPGVATDQPWPAKGPVTALRELSRA